MPETLILPRSAIAAPIAHRGLYGAAVGDGAPENSLGAARNAIAKGFAIELDLQPSADGEPMVFHDAALDRLTDGDGRIWERSVAELSELRLNGRAGEPIPSFAQFLDLVAGRAMLFVELKGDAPDAANDAVLERAAALLRTYDGPAAFMSFDRRLVEAARRAAPERPAGLVAEGGVLDLPALGAGFVTHDLQALPTEETVALRAGGTPVLAWTIKDRAAAERARLVADQITFSGFLPNAPS